MTDNSIFVATYGYNKLYKNDGRGGFSDVTSYALTGNDHMVGASWVTTIMMAG